MTAIAPLSLPVDVPELCIALAAEAGDLRWYLDLETGDVLLVTREWDANEHGGLDAQDVEANQVRFLRVPPADARNATLDMEAYAAQIDDARLRESLELALSAPRPERRFRAVLGWLPEEQDRWRTYRHLRLEERAHAWLKRVGVVAAHRAEVG